MDSRVVQGAVPSPFLFTNLTNSLRPFNNNLNIGRYANDAVLIVPLSTDEDF